MTYYQIKAVAPDRAEVRIDGTIGGGWFDEDSVTAKSFAKELKAAGKVKSLDIYINSPGGSVFDGSAIYSQLKRHTAKKTVYIEGLAASIASMIAMAGDEIVMPDNALMMIHRASGGVWGNADDMRKTAEILEKIESSIITAYQAKTGRDPEELAEMMADETWLTAQEAVALGFADRTTDPITITACADAAELRHFKRLPSTVLARAPFSTVSSKEPVMADEPIINSPATVAESDQQLNQDVAPDQPQAVVPEPVATMIPVAVDTAALRAEILAAETTRRAAIRALVTPALLERPGVQACLEACLDDPDLSADTASRRLLAELGKTAEPLAATAFLTEFGVDSNAPLEEQCTAQWQHDPVLRDEFGDQLSAYLAFRRAENAGQVRIFRK